MEVMSDETISNKSRCYQCRYENHRCVRVTNSDQLAIQNVLNNQSQKTGVLEIIERDT